MLCMVFQVSLVIEMVNESHLFNLTCTDWFTARNGFHISATDSGFVNKSVFANYVKEWVKWKRSMFAHGPLLFMFDGASVHGFDEGDVLEGILNDDPDILFLSSSTTRRTLHRCLTMVFLQCLRSKTPAAFPIFLLQRILDRR